MNEKFNFRSVTGLQKLAQLENMFPNIIEGCFCQKTFVRHLFEGTLHFILSLVDYKEIYDTYFQEEKNLKQPIIF